VILYKRYTLLNCSEAGAISVRPGVERNVRFATQMDHIIELPEWRDRVQVFGDRADAGAVLAGMLESLGGSDALLLGHSAGRGLYFRTIRTAPGRMQRVVAPR
jgi:hypothetical protein